MRLLQTLLITALTVQTFARCKRPRPSPVMGALQNILSPANVERTMQMVKMATPRPLGNAVPYSPPNPMQYSPPILPMPEAPCTYPIANPILPVPEAPSIYSIANQLSNQLQLNSLSPAVPSPPLPLQMSYQTLLPNPPPQNLIPAQMPNLTPIQLPNPIQLPSPTPLVQVPEVVLEKPMPLPCPCRQEIYPVPEPNYFYSPPVAPIPEPIPLTPAQDIFSCPIPSPAALFNPFLPAASPVSTWTVENMPTATCGTRSQYLRKIPIPPPTL